MASTAVRTKEGCARGNRGYDRILATAWRVSEWLAATLEMWCRETGCEFESRALRFHLTCDCAKNCVEDHVRSKCVLLFPVN
jgi:hypothetical protein